MAPPIVVGAYYTVMAGGAAIGGYMFGHSANNVVNKMNQDQAPPPAAAPAPSNSTSSPGNDSAAAGQGARQQLAGNSGDCGTGDCPQSGNNQQQPKKPSDHEKELGTDPATGKYSQAEADAGTRLEQQLGTDLSRSPHEGADFIDSSGKTYDAVGPAPSEYFNSQSFNSSIGDHLLKSNDFTVVDTTGLTGSQSASVDNYLSGLSPAQQGRIIRLGK